MTCNPPELVDLASEEEDEAGDDVKDDVVDDDSDDEVEMLDVVLGTEKPPEAAAASPAVGIPAPSPRSSLTTSGARPWPATALTSRTVRSPPSSSGMKDPVRLPQNL